MKNFSYIFIILFVGILSACDIDIDSDSYEDGDGDGDGDSETGSDTSTNNNDTDTNINCTEICEDRECGLNDCGTQCPPGCENEESCTHDGHCVSSDWLAVQVKLPENKSFTSKGSRKVLIDLVEYDIESNHVAYAPFKEGEPRIVGMTIGDDLYLAALAYAGFQDEPILSAETSAEMLAYLAVGGFVLPSEVLEDFFATLRAETNLIPLATAITEALQAGQSPFEPTDTAFAQNILSELENIVIDFNNWIDSNSSKSPASSSSGSNESSTLPSIDIKPSTSQGGFLVNATMSNKSEIVLSIKNTNVRAGRAIVNRIEPIEYLQSRVKVKNISPAEFSYLASLWDLISGSGSPIVSSNTILDPISSYNGDNSLEIIIIADSSTEQLPASDKYYNDLKWAKRWNTWQIIIWPLIKGAMGLLADEHCISEVAWSAYELITMATNPDITDLPALVKLAMTTIRTSNFSSCFGGLPPTKLIQKAGRVLTLISLIKFTTNGILGIASKHWNAPVKTKFTASFCNPSCLNECGSDRCGGECPNNCTSNEYCDSTSSECKSCECSSGECCDGCFFRSSPYMCKSLYSQEQRCQGACGGRAEQRTASQLCSGSEANCNGTVIWGDWAILEVCPSTEMCTVDNIIVRCQLNASCQTIMETCNGIDDDKDGIIDNKEACWKPVYRFRNPSADFDKTNRCYSNTTSPPSSCAGWTLEYSEPIFYLYSSAYWPDGTDVISQFWKQNGDPLSKDHVLVKKNSDEYNALISGGKYQYIGDLGHMSRCGAGQPTGQFYKPQNAMTANVRELKRYYYSSGSGFYSHWITTNPLEIPTSASWLLESNFNSCYVWASQW